MDKIINSYVKKFKEKRRKKRQMAMLLSVPALFLAIVVCWQLHLTGIALTDGNVSVNDAAEEGVVYTADAVDEGDMAVTVTAPEGALPEGAELSVSLYEETSEEYAAAAESIEYDADDEETAMAAMDISFLADGEEVEPAEPVTVSIDMTTVLPEDADLETVEVSHLCETEDGVEAELVADATDETEGTVDPETGVVEFEAESFSTFTITCSYLAQSDGETDQQTQTSTSCFTDTADVEEGDNLTVTVTAPEGALPEGAELSVTLYDETCEEYTAAGESIEYDADDEETGMAAMDISFLVDGEEVEPSEPVTVSIDVSAILPEDADIETVEVSHLCETEDGVEAELVADATDETKGTVDTETGMAEFEVESFSTFTLNWYTHSAGGPNKTNYGATITVNVYTTDDGKNYSLASGDSLTYTINTSTSDSLTISISDLTDAVSGIDDYEYSYATVTYGSIAYGSSANSVTSVTASYTKNGGNGPGSTATYSYTSTVYTANDKSGITGPSASTTSEKENVNYFTINLYYGLQDGVSITDNIAADGTFVATLVVDGAEVTDTSDYIFTWYKSETENGDYTEVTDSSVLSGDGTAVNVALDQGGLYYYKVVVTDSSGNEIGTAVMQVPYAMELLNGSFENNGYGTSDEDAIPYWSTTASDKKIEIGTYAADNSAYGTQNIYAGGSQTIAGDQFAELNANSEGSLYQDVLTAGGLELNWSLYHRARTADGSTTIGEETDTMYVVIMSAEDAEKVLEYADASSSSQQTILTDMISNILNNGSEVTGSTNAAENKTGTYSFTLNETTETITVTVWTLSTTTSQNGDWTYYYGTYTVPEGQYLTRFFFVSGTTGTNISTVGNLIDDVKFSQKLTYTIEYWVWDSNKNEYVLRETSTETDEVTPYTNVSASHLSDYSDYALVGSVTGIESGGSTPTFDSSTTTGIKVQSGTTYLSLYFKNSGVSVIKVVEGLTDNDLSDLDNYTVSIPITNSSNNAVTQLSITVGESGSASVYMDLAAGKYTIKEENYPTSLIDGSYVWTSVSVSGATSTENDGEYTFTLNQGSALTITFTNTYEEVTVSYELPETGGSGTWPYILIGLLLSGTAIFLLYRRNGSAGA